MEILKLSSWRLKNSYSFHRKLINIIKKGKVIIFPTDTIYGLLADATNKKAVEKIFRIKKRSRKNYLPLFIKDITTAKRIARINREQEKFLRKVWPGKVTLVLKKKRGINLYGVASTTIALRIPNFKPLNRLLKKLDIPLTATSANISGKPASNNIEKILKQFINKKNKPDFIVDAGNFPEREPSTIIDLTKKSPKILRA